MLTRLIPHDLTRPSARAVFEGHRSLGARALRRFGLLPALIVRTPGGRKEPLLLFFLAVIRCSSVLEALEDECQAVLQKFSITAVCMRVPCRSQQSTCAEAQPANSESEVGRPLTEQLASSIFGCTAASRCPHFSLKVNFKH